ncbi:pyridoxamine 5'-phosphate oxidase family protein [Kineococcus auxinigenes]|uniref:pyridoxamine 5'-phosphate oxidase family protein n=1 Tax=unclassified Kineococcus TaxID=2621656 RepID=UPI003D7EEDD1
MMLSATVPAAAGVLLPLAPEECLALLATRPFGRVVFTHRALPAVLPVNFLLDDGAVLLRVQPRSALATAAGGTVVAFQADDIDAATRTGWSVTAVGRADVVGDEVRQRALDGLAAWAGGERDHVVRIGLEQLTGRRLAQVPVLPGAVGA